MLIIETTYNAEEKIWRGADDQIFVDGHRSIGDVVLEALKENGTDTFEVSQDDNKVTTFAEALITSVRLAQFLQQRGLTHEHVVGLLTRNNHRESQVVLACLMNATPFHAVTARLETDDIAAVFAITKPKVIFCDGCDYALLSAGTKDWSPLIVTLSNHLGGVTRIEDLLGATGTEEQYRPVQLLRGADQTMGIICTSGTTGLPKAATLTNAQLLLITTSGGTKDVMYTPSGYEWITGVKTLLVCLISGAPRIVARRAFSPKQFLDIVSEHKVTSCVLSSWQFHWIFTSPLATVDRLASLQMVIFGGGPVAVGILLAAQRLLESTLFMFVYGTTETDVVAVGINPDKENLVGALPPGRMVKIVDEQGVALGPNEMGEILIKTNQHWNGYYRNPEQTARTRDAQGWFHMGDLGYFDDDGNLFVVDRKKDLLKYKSMHYTPNEIEKIIAELPEVQDVCVVGIKDTLHGDAAGALIVRKPESTLSELQVIEHVRRSTTKEYKQLHAGVQFVEELPHNVNGKLLRNAAREMFQVSRMPKASL
ncbi:hypothetical protein KR222_011556 [Zaprionus bogoriensis]|nr:hypothetical protein KR222_011556 [Zaprionus bogoriensis]